MLREGSHPISGQPRHRFVAAQDVIRTIDKQTPQCLQKWPQNG